MKKSKIILLSLLISNILYADQMAEHMKEGCQIIVNSNAKKWNSKSVPSAYYIHGLTDMNLRINNASKKLTLNQSLMKSYNKAAFITCKKSLANNENVNFREKLYFYNAELILSYYK